MKKVYPLAFFICILFLIFYAIFAYTGIIFRAETLEEPIGSISGWCERVSSGIFREPMNAFSNIAFMVSGLFIFKILNSDKTNNENKFYGLNKISILYGTAVIFLGPGSMLMHGTHTEWGGWADNLSMIMFIIFPWLYNLKEMGRWSENRFIYSYFFIVIAYALARWFFGGRLGIGLDLFGLSIGLWIISEYLFRFWSPKARWISGFVGFIVAFIFGITPFEIFSNLENYWWVLLFWIPAIFSSNKSRTTRKYTPWFFL